MASPEIEFPTDPFIANPSAAGPAAKYTPSAGWKRSLDKTGLSPVADAGYTFTFPKFWGLTFSVTENSKQPWLGSVTNDSAWTGDESKTGVMALKVPTLADNKDLYNKVKNLTLKDVLAAFGIPLDDTTQPVLKGFLTALDATNNLTGTTLITSGNPANTNALWCYTDNLASSYRQVTSLAFSLAIDDPTPPVPSKFDKIIIWLNKLINSKAIAAQIKQELTNIAAMQMTFIDTATTRDYGPAATASSQDYSRIWSLRVSFPIKTFTAHVTFQPDDWEITLTPASETATGGLWDRLNLSQLLSGGKDDPKAGDLPSQTGDTTNISTGPLVEFFKSIDVWFIRVTKSRARDGSALILWEIRLCAAWKAPDSVVGQYTPVFALGYNSKTATFTGQMMLADDIVANNSPRRRGPDFNILTELPSKVKTKIGTNQKRLNLFALFSKKQVPRGLPVYLSKALVTYTGTPPNSPADSSVSAFMLQTSLTNEDGTVGTVTVGSSKTAPAPFSWTPLDVSAFHYRSKQGNSISRGTDFKFYTAIVLNDTSGKYPPAAMNLALSYASQTNLGITANRWYLRGTASNLSFGLLKNFFRPESQGDATTLLDSLSLKILEVNYTYAGVSSDTTADAEATSFLLSGSIALGELALDLNYQYVSESHAPSEPTAAAVKWTGANATQPPNVMLVQPAISKPAWSFEAYLSAGSPSSTVASIVNSLSPKSGDRLPAFIGRIPIKPRAGISAPVKLKYRGDANNSILMIWIEIGVFNFTFVQASINKGPTKRILRVACDTIPILKEVPLVKELPQPFDKLLYVWIGDDDATQSAMKGINISALDPAASTPGTGTFSIGTELVAFGIPAIAYQRVLDPASASSTAIAIRAGHHFMITDRGTVIVDHAFNNVAGSEQTRPPANGASLAGATTPPASPPSQGVFQKESYGIKFNGVSFAYAENTLKLTFDCTISFGPAQLTLLGFGVNLNVKDLTLDNLKPLEVIATRVRISLNGIQAKFEQAPLLIAGLFARDQSEAGVDSYKGGVGVGFKDWQFLGVGQYRKDAQGRKNLFVYAKLDGPLFTIGFAQFKGARVAFGINSNLRTIQASDLHYFPLTQDPAGLSTAGADPLKVLTAFLSPTSGKPAFVMPLQDAYWFALGARATAFEILNIIAVVILGFKPGGVVISVLANAVLKQPTDRSRESALIYLEAGLAITLNTVEGYFSVDAAISPQSFVLTPSCKVQGGVSIYSWFGKSPFKGDWVVSIGGFHPTYNRPPHYPNPDRIGISFTMGDNINVQGLAYAAVTPKCAMAGALMNMEFSIMAQYRVDVVFRALLDIFVMYKPLHFNAQFGVLIKCTGYYDIDWVRSAKEVAEVSSRIWLEGPNPFYGTAFVNFWFCKFAIEFGGAPEPVIPPSLLEFYRSCVREAGPPVENNDDKTPGNVAVHKWVLESGAAPSTTVKADENNSFPDSGAGRQWFVSGGSLRFRIDADFPARVLFLNNWDAGIKEDAYKNPIYAKPTKNDKPLMSVLYLKVFRLTGANVYPTDAQLVPGFTGEAIYRDLPTALYGKYEAQQDPWYIGSERAAQGELKDHAGGLVRLCQGVRLFPPAPKLAQSAIQPFVALQALRAAPADPTPRYLPDILPIQGRFVAGTPDWQHRPSAQERWISYRGKWTTGPQKVRSQLVGDATDARFEGGMLGLLVKELGWNTPADPVAGAKDGWLDWGLNARAPSALIGGLENYWDVLPLECAVFA